MKMSSQEALQLAEIIQQREELLKLKKLFAPAREVEIGKCVVRLHAEPEKGNTEWDHMMLPKSILVAMLENGEIEDRINKEIFDIEERLAIDGIHIHGMPEDLEGTP